MANRMVMTPIEMEINGEKMGGAMFTDSTHQTMVLCNKEYKTIIRKRTRNSYDEDFGEWSEPVEI